MLSQILRDLGEEIQSRHKSITIPTILRNIWAEFSTSIQNIQNYNTQWRKPHDVESH